jgi:hypothetical protein
MVVSSEIGADRTARLDMRSKKKGYGAAYGGQC